jgi:signal transduction histidine kinase
MASPSPESAAAMHSHRRAMSSQWPAGGAETDPLRRVRQLQKSWERLLAAGALGPELPPGATAGLRPTIVESWRRSLATGLDPTDLLAPIEADEEEVLGRWFEHPLGSLTHVLTEQLRKVVEESRGMIVVTDASGLVLHRVGDESLKERAAAEMNLVEGARYSEAADGTNGIGTALAADHAFQVFAFEHFNERHHEWVCSGVPVHDPVSGQTVGLIDLSSLWKFAHPRSLELVTTAARTIEQCLLDARRDRDSRLRRRYSDFMTRSTDLLVDRDGYVLDGAELGHPIPFDIPEGGGEVVLGDGSVAVAAPLGRGEAYLLRRGTTSHAKSVPPVKGLERAEERARELAAEQAALRQVATLVARESSPDQLFAVVAEQVARIFDVPHVRLVLYEPDGSFVVGGYSEGDDEPFPIGSRWPLDSPGVTATVRQTGRSARVEDYAHMAGEVAAVVRGAGMHSAVASPIVVERRLWGAMVVLSPRDEPFPEDTEARLTDFTELVATAIANAESREALARLAEEQAALRRVATLVAESAPPAEISSAVSNEVATLFRTEMVVVGKFDGDPAALLVVGVGDGTDEPVVGSRWKLDEAMASTAVYRTGLPARVDHDLTIADPDVAAIVERFRPVATVAVPIKVEGRLWGAMIVSTRDALLPTDTEERLQRFTDLIATALANAEARAEVERLAEEQATLRRLAVLVAQQPSPSEVFTAVTQAVGLLLGADLAVLHLFRGDGTATTIASWSGDGGPILADRVTVSTLDGDSLAARIFESGAPARIDSYAGLEGEAADLARSLRLRSAVGAPILVQGKLWGALMAATRGVEPWAENAEARIAAFTELAATAIANAESREALAELAEEQAALRRVATLVARGAPPMDLFGAVAEEVGRLHSVDRAYVTRFDSEDTVTLMARWTETGEAAPAELPRRLAAGPMSAAVRETGGPVRLTYSDAIEAGVRSTVAAPITVEGDLWGSISAASMNPERPPAPGTETRLSNFSDLVATAIANVEGRSELAASRRRIVAASDDARRRIERDLHDGVQQQLVSLSLAVGRMEAGLRSGDALKEPLASVSDNVGSILDSLVEIARGIHPSILSQGGLEAALNGLARRSPVPVEVYARIDGPLPDALEVAAYYVASEALTNVAKHARASVVHIAVTTDDGNLTLTVRDDGVGGADMGEGSGLVGLQDRVEALGGTIAIDSSAGQGTCVVATLPIATELDQEIDNVLVPPQSL